MSQTTQKLIEADKRYLWHPFTQMAGWTESEPLVIDRAEGFFLIDSAGRRYIDGVSSLWCNVHGHRVQKIDDAIKAQLEKVAHSTLLGLTQTTSIELAEKLVEITPKGLEKVFYSDSGATSVEIALKLAFQYHRNIGQNNRTGFIALKNSYHGDTIGAVSLGGMDLFHSIFKPLLFETLHAPCPYPYRFGGTEEACLDYCLGQTETILKEHSNSIAALIMEPLVQGAAGIIVHPHGFLKGVRELTKKYGVLLIVDEVATGFGRTAKMFACECENVQPDIMCLGKGITGGYLPLAATLTTEKIFNAFLGQIPEHKTFYHGHTYTGNALCCAAALASLELFKENKIIQSLPPKAALIEKYLKEIAQLPFVGNVRQYGLMAGIELVADKQTKQSFPTTQTVAAKLCAAMRPKGAIMRPLGDCLVVMPPVAIDNQTLEDLLRIVTEAIKNDLPSIAG